MTDRFFTAENVLDLMQGVFPIRVLKDAKGEYICQLQFYVPGHKGLQELSCKLKDMDHEYDHYDGLYCLMNQAKSIIEKGFENVDNLIVANEGEDPIAMLQELTKP